MRKNTFLYLLLSAVVLFGCSKDEESKSSLAIPESSGNGAEPTTYVFTGEMNVDKNDSNWVDISNYVVPFSTSKIIKSTSNYVLSTNFDATALKGEEVIHSIPVEIPVNYFSEYTGGVGIFELGVINGYFDKDSLYYHVLYRDINNNNIYLDFEGHLTDSY